MGLVNEMYDQVETMYEEGLDKNTIWERLNSTMISDTQLDTLISILEEEDGAYFTEIIGKIYIEIGKSSPTLADDIARTQPSEINDRCNPADWQQPRRSQ
tara:strand:- start:1172 stop:1471 length:300 start_codon:yes stop_codon:yes gene_type:complete